MNTEQLIQNAKAAIKLVYKDQSVNREAARDNLSALSNYIDDFMGAIDEGIDL